MLIQVAVDYQHDTIELDKKTVQTFIALGGRGARPKTCIYTSHGNTSHTAVDETSPLHPIETVRWRPRTEDSLTKPKCSLKPGKLIIYKRIF